MTPVLPMSSGEWRCPCGGEYERRAADVQMTVDDELVTMDDLPQDACIVCGSEVYSAAVLEAVESRIRGRPEPAPRVLR